MTPTDTSCVGAHDGRHAGLRPSAQPRPARRQGRDPRHPGRCRRRASGSSRRWGIHRSTTRSSPRWTAWCSPEDQTLTPSLWGEPVHPTTVIDETRDRLEYELLAGCIERGITIYSSLLEIYKQSAVENITTLEAADRKCQQTLDEQKGRNNFFSRLKGQNGIFKNNNLRG